MSGVLSTAIRVALGVCLLGSCSAGDPVEIERGPPVAPEGDASENLPVDSSTERPPDTAPRADAGPATPPAADDAAPLPVPDVPSGPLRGVTALALGGGHSCALAEGGRVWCWGGDVGAPGLGRDYWLSRSPSEDTRAAPVEIAEVEEITAGQNSVCAIRTDTTVLCWSELGPEFMSSYPELRLALPDGSPSGLTDVVDVSTSYSHACAVDGSGVVSCWGHNESAQLGFAADDTVYLEAQPVQSLPPVTQVATGSRRSCALGREGDVWCWGDLNPGSRNEDETPMISAPILIGGLSQGVELSARGLRVCVRHAEGSVTCWGQGFGGSPTPVLGVSDAIAIATGYSFACAVRADGHVLCWGENREGQLGRPTDGARLNELPAAEVVEIDDAVDVAAGWHHACAQTRDGGVKCWGVSREGQTGHRTQIRLRPREVSGLPQIVEIKTSFDAICARGADDAVYCWGNGFYSDCEGNPQKISGLSAGNQLATGFNVGCVLNTDGTVVCWDGAGAIASIPGFTNVEGLAATGIDLCARHADGGVSCGVSWGLQDLIASVRPLDGFGSVTQLVAGANRFCGLRSDGSIACFHFERGELKISAHPDLGKPTALLGASGSLCFVGTENDLSCWESYLDLDEAPIRHGQTFAGPIDSAAGGGAMQCVVLADGSPWCWGLNHQGELGQGTWGEETSAPVQPLGLGPVRDIQAVYAAACALTEDGRVMCWGINESRVVDPTTPCHHSTPYEVNR